MTIWRQLIRCRLASSSGGQPAMNIASSGGSSPIRSYSARHRPPLGRVLAWPARASSSVLLVGRRLERRPPAKTCCMTPVAAGNSNGCGPACSPASTGLQYTVRAHELARGRDVRGQAGDVAVQVHVEQVEAVPARVGHVVEEPPLRAVRLAAEDVVAAPAEHDRGRRVRLLDGPVHGRELRDVLLGRAGPEQVGVARLVVALPVADPAGEPADDLPDELRVGGLVAGRRRRQEVGRPPGRPRRARAQRDPDLPLRPAVELREQRVGRVPAVFAGLRARPGSRTRTPAPAPRRARLACGTNSPGGPKSP